MVKDSEGGSSAWIGREAAIELAIRGVEKIDRQLPQSAGLSDLGTPRSALLVLLLEHPGNGYYLVPWESEEGVGMIARVDAKTGELLGATAARDFSPYPFLSVESAIQIIQLDFPAEEIGEPRLVWKPCRESTTPSRPLFQVPFKDGSIYVDMDGKIFNELTPLGRGG